MESITPCSGQSTEFHICLAQTNLNAIFNAAPFPPLRTTLVHYNLSPINTTSRLSTMSHYSYISLPEDSDSLTESSITLLGDTSSNISSPIPHEDPIVALTSGATIGLSNLHPTQANLGLRTVQLPEVDLPPTDDSLPTVQSPDINHWPVNHGLPSAESVLQNCEQYTPYLVLSILTVIQ